MGAGAEGTRRGRGAFLAARAAREKQRAPNEPFPESFEHPGAYQWEALTDDQAASLMRPVTGLVDAAAWELVGDAEAVYRIKVRRGIRGSRFDTHTSAI